MSAKCGDMIPKIRTLPIRGAGTSPSTASRRSPSILPKGLPAILESHMDIPAEFLAAAINTFQANKRLADRAVERVPDDKLHVPLDANTNSIAVIMKHIAGNLLSRWT